VSRDNGVVLAVYIVGFGLLFVLWLFAWRVMQIHSDVRAICEAVQCDTPPPAAHGGASE